MKSLIWIPLAVWLAQTATAAVSPVEVDLAEAALAYQSGRAEEALRMVGWILKDAPNTVKALELKGLILREQGDNESALETFDALRSLAARAKVSPATAAPYDFQSGMILVEMQRYDEARPLLVNAVKADFNPAPAKYFLGVAAFQQKLDAEATSHFRYVVRTKADLLRASAYYYLGVLANRREDPKQAIWDWREARLIAQNLLKQPDSTDATKASARALIDRTSLASSKISEHGKNSDLSLYAALITAYDSNVLLSPLINIGATGQPTVMSTLRYAGTYNYRYEGHQLTPTLRGSANYNFNPNAHGGQFFINDASLTYTRHPEAASHWGVRAGLLYIMRNNVTTADPTGSLTGQSLGTTLAPFMRWVGSHFQWTGEILITPQLFFTDSELPSYLRKSGFDWRMRHSLQYTSGNSFFNPTLIADIALTQTDGEEFRSRGGNLLLLNTLPITERMNLHLRGALAYHEYPSRPTGIRYDTEVTGGAQFDFKVMEEFHVLGEFSYLENLSNIEDIYRYNRMAVGLGADYRF